MVKYPVGQACFREIRNRGFQYADKTMYIHQLVEIGKYFFLSRPCCFGKTMLVSTMESYFRGERELFRGLAIDILEPEEWTKYPVLRLDFTILRYDEPGLLLKVLSEIMSRWEKEYGLPHRNDSPEARLDKIIRDLYEKTGKQVVVLVDEADRPFVDVGDNPELKAENQRILYFLYRVLKADEDYLKFVFLTAVGKLTRLDLYSGLNCLLDISFHPDFSAICGITEQEILDNFHDGVKSLASEY